MNAIYTAFGEEYGDMIGPQKDDVTTEAISLETDVGFSCKSTNA